DQAGAEQQPRRRRGKGRMMLLGLLVMGGLLALGIIPRLRQNTMLSARQHEVEAGRVSVTMVRPERAPAATEFVLPGTIQALEETALYARVNGYLHERFVDIGARVRAGQVLAVIETPELDQELVQAHAALAQAEVGVPQTQAKLNQARATHQQARAGLEQARATLALAQVAKDRWNALVELQGAVSRQEADEKRTAAEVGQANVTAAQATVEATRASVSVAEADVAAARTSVAAQQANVQRLTALRSFQQLTAPFDGIITARTVDRGALITAGSGGASAPLFRMARAERLRIYVRVPQTWVRALTPGGQARVLVPEFPERTFLGHVVSTAGALDQASRTLLTEIQIPNDDGSLLPGMFANVQFAITRAEPPLWLPATALILGAGGMQVALVRDDQTVHFQTVEVGHDLGRQVEIVAGLTGTESVILHGGDGLREGLRVRPGG
ncbi:MAG TPA: efflux RND transporter periplasmic adaptor subunit, partial [Candidatus Dormibacteraeota bacterium]|nr:efflux RND transporter periplasmic adaptor subunit [Candidatus Dormibacteraeota bacterium]